VTRKMLLKIMRLSNGTIFSLFQDVEVENPRPVGEVELVESESSVRLRAI
jgi:hypothetical protein